jgi:hypothetical protein
LLEAKQLLELDAVAEIAVGEMALVDDAAGAFDVGTRIAGEISGHAKSHGQRRADSQGQRAAHKEAGAGDVGSFRGKFGLGRAELDIMEVKRDLQRLQGTGAFFMILHGALLARTERSTRSS